MSFSKMVASAERLSKNLERKMTKPIVKKESKMNVNEKQIKKVPMMMRATTVRIVLKNQNFSYYLLIL